MGTHAFVDWKRFLRDICAKPFIQHPFHIGGPGFKVEIDESVFNRRKYNHGCMVMEQRVFGGIDTATKQGSLVSVGNRNANILLPIIQQYVLPGSTIMSDCWAAYTTVAHLGYNHLTVNHTYFFVDPVYNMWMHSKRRFATLHRRVYVAV